MKAFLLFLLIQGAAQQPAPPPPPATAPAQAGTPTGQAQPVAGQPSPTPPGNPGFGQPARPANADPFFDPGAVRKRALLVPWESSAARAEYAKKQGFGSLGAYLTSEVTLVGIFERDNRIQVAFRTPNSSALTFGTTGSRFFNGRIIKIVTDGQPSERKVIVEGRQQPNGKLEKIEIPLRKDGTR